MSAVDRDKSNEERLTEYGDGAYGGGVPRKRQGDKTGMATDPIDIQSIMKMAMQAVQYVKQ